MEKQIILTTRLVKELGYFSVWKFGKRVPGSFNPYLALECSIDGVPHNNESLENLDVLIAPQFIIMWDES